MLQVGRAASRATAPWVGLATCSRRWAFCGCCPPAASSTEKPAHLGDPWVPLDTFTSEGHRATCPAPEPYISGLWSFARDKGEPV